MLLALLDTLGVRGKVAYFWNANFLRSKKECTLFTALCEQNKNTRWAGFCCVDLRYKIVVSEGHVLIFLFLGGKISVRRFFVCFVFSILKDFVSFQWFILSKNIIAKSPLFGCYKTLSLKKKIPKFQSSRHDGKMISITFVLKYICIYV